MPVALQAVTLQTEEAGKDGAYYVPIQNLLDTASQYVRQVTQQTTMPVESGEYSGELNFESGLNEVLEKLGYEGGLSDGKTSSWIRTYYDQPAKFLAVDFNDESLALPVSRTQRLYWVPFLVLRIKISIPWSNGS